MTTIHHITPANNGIPSNQMLKAVKSLHKQWSKQLKSKTIEEVNEVIKHCSDDAFMLLGNGMESLTKNIIGRDHDLRKILLTQLQKYCSLNFHEECNRSNEYAPLPIYTKRILAFLQQATVLGCTGNGISSITCNFESSDMTIVELSLNIYRTILAAILSLPVSNKLRTNFVDAQASASANASGAGSDVSTSTAVLALIKYIEQGSNLLTKIPSVHDHNVSHPIASITNNHEEHDHNNLPTATAVPKRKITNPANIPDPATLPLLSTPTIVGVIEALRAIHLLANECYNPSHSANARPTYEDVIQNGFTNVTSSVPPKSISHSGSTSSGGVNRSLSPRRSSNGIATASLLKSSLTSYLPRLLPALLALAQVRSVELDDEPNAKSSTQTIRSLATLCIADFTWILVATSPSLGSSTTATATISRTNTTNSAVPIQNYDGNARLALIQNMTTIISILSKALYDNTNKVQSAILRFAMEQTGAATPNGEIPPQVHTNLAPPVVVPEPVPHTKAPEKPTGKAPVHDKKGAKDAKPEPALAPVPAPAPAPSPAPVIIGAEYGLEAGQYEFTCKYLLANNPAGEENQCWSSLNPMELGIFTANDAVPKVRIMDNDTTHNHDNDHVKHENEKKYDTFSFSVATLEHSYTDITHILAAFLRCSTAVPFISGTFASIADNEHEDDQDESKVDHENTNIDKRIPTWNLVSMSLVSILAIPESNHKREVTKLAALLLARMAACSDTLRTTACAAGVLPVLASRLRDTDTDLRTRDVVEGVIHVLLSPVSTVLETNVPVTIPVPTNNTNTAINPNRSVASIHSSMISGTHAGESKHDHDESKHDTGEDDGIAVLQGNPHHPSCVPLIKSSPRMISSDYLAEITDPDVPSTFVRRLVDPRVLVLDTVNANAAGVAIDNNTNKDTPTPADMKSPTKGSKPPAKEKVSATTSETHTDKATLIPEPALPAGLTRHTNPASSAAPFGAWLGTIDIALLLCTGYVSYKSQTSNSTPAPVNHTVGTPSGSRPPSRSATDASAVNPSTAHTSSSGTDLAPVAPPSTVFEHTCPDVPSNWPIWNIPIDELPPLIPWEPITVGSGKLHTESEEDEHHHNADDKETVGSQNQSHATGTKASTVATKPGTVATTGKGSVAPSHAPTNAPASSTTKKGGSASSVAASESATRGHAYGSLDIPKPTMTSIVKFYSLLLPSATDATKTGALYWDTRLRGLRLAASFLQISQENQQIRDLLLAAKVPAMVARIMVDAVTCAYRIPFMVGSVAGTQYTAPNPAGTIAEGVHTTSDVTSTVQSTIQYYQTIMVDMDILLQSLLITFHMLFSLLRLPGNASADICITLSELGPIVPDSILAAALHTDILKIIPSLQEVFNNSSKKLNMNHFNRTESFLIPVCLTDPRSILHSFDKIPGASSSTYALHTEVAELRSWALYTLRAFAAADREHRIYDWSTPDVPIPNRHASNEHDNASNDKGKGAASGKGGAPPKDAGKKPADKGKGAPATHDTPTVAVNTVFKSPVHPSAGSPVVGVDWNCKTESIGERLALSVLRYLPLLMTSLSHNATAGGILYPILSGPLATSNLAVQPLTGSALRIGILRLIDESLTIYRARDRLAVEIMGILREYSLVAATLRQQHQNSESSLSGYTASALSVAQRLFTAPRQANGIPVLYGRLGTLVLGYSMGFNGQLHSLTSAGYGGPNTNAVTNSATAPTPVPVAADKKAPAKPAPVDKKGGKGVIEVISSSTESFAAILAARRNWRHPVEGWGTLPIPTSSQIEDILAAQTNHSAGHESGDANHTYSNQPSAIFHDIDRFCTVGSTYYMSIEQPFTEQQQPQHHETHSESRPPTSTNSAKPDPKKPAPATKTPEPAPTPVKSHTEHSTSIHLPDIFTLPMYVWPISNDIQANVQSIFGAQPNNTFNGQITATSVSTFAVEIHQLYQSSTIILTNLLKDVPLSLVERICHDGTLAIQDSARAILLSCILGGFVKPISVLTSYMDPLPSEVEILLGFRILSRLATDAYRGAGTQSVTSECAAAEAIRAGLILHSLAMTDIPPVPVESHEFSHNAVNNFTFGVRPIRSLPHEKLYLWKNGVVLSPTGRNIITMEARSLLGSLRNRPNARLQHWGRKPTVHTRPLSPEESSAIHSLGEHPDWSLLPEGVTSVDVANHTVTEEIYLGRDDPLYPSILDGYLTTLQTPIDMHADAHETHETHAPTVHDLALSLPILKRSTLTYRQTYFSSFVFGPLLDLSTPVGRLGNHVLSPFFAAIALDADESLITSFLTNGAFVDVRRSGDDVTPLMAALASGKLSFAATLLDHGADPNARDGSGNPVIKYAFVTTNEHDKKDIQALEADRTAVAVELPMQTVYSTLLTLLEHTYSHPSGIANRQSTAHTSATASLGSIQQMFGASAAILQRMARRMILRRRLDAARRSLRDSHSLKNHVPVVFADRKMVIDAMRLLIDSGADVVTARDAGGNSVLHWLVAGAFLMYPPLRTKSCRYIPVFHAPPALGEDTRKLMDLFLTYGARINGQNNRGATPLHCALECGKMAISVHLVKLGADTALADKIGCLPMHYAALGRGFHDVHPGLSNVHESNLSDLSGELNAAEAALFEEQSIGENMPHARIVSPRAEFFLDMVLRALQHGREVDGNNISNHPVSTDPVPRNAPIRPKVRARRVTGNHNQSTYSSKEMDGDDFEFSDSKENDTVDDSRVLHPLTPADILLHTNRYGITPLHVAAGANIDGTLSLTLRQGSTAYSMPTTFTGVHPMLLTLARHGTSVRAAAITVKGVSLGASETEVQVHDNTETFIMVAINREYTAEFLYGCADETAARADIVYTALGLPDVLSGARAILAEVRAMHADSHLRELLTDCMNLFESRRGHVAATKVISREDVQDATKYTLELAHNHAEALVTARCKSGRNALHYTMLSWHSPLQELIGAGGKFLLGRDGTLSPANMKTRNGIAAGLRAHYAACWRIARYLVAAARGTLATPVMREPMTIESWRRSRPRHVRTLAYIPSTEEDKGGHTDADTVPYPGVALIQRREIISDASAGLLVEDRPPIGRIRAVQRAANPSKKASTVTTASVTIDSSIEAGTVTPQPSQLSDTSISSAGSLQLEARKEEIIHPSVLRGYTPVGYSLLHLRMLSMYSTALAGLDCNDLGIAINIPTDDNTSTNNNSSTVSFTDHTFVPPNLGTRGIIESPTWAIIALSLLHGNGSDGMDNIESYYRSQENLQKHNKNFMMEQESKDKEADEQRIQPNNSITLGRERAKRSNPAGTKAASLALENLGNGIEPSASLLKVLKTVAQ